MCICIYMYMHIYLYIHVYMYIYITHVRLLFRTRTRTIPTAWLIPPKLVKYFCKQIRYLFKTNFHAVAHP